MKGGEGRLFRLLVFFEFFLHATELNKTKSHINLIEGLAFQTDFIGLSLLSCLANHDFEKIKMIFNFFYLGFRMVQEGARTQQQQNLWHIMIIIKGT